MEEYLRYWIILKRRWLPVSIVFLTLLGLSIVKTVLETPIYQASGQLVLKKNSTSSLTGVGDQLGQLENSVTGRSLGTEIAVLRSLPIAEKTISSLKLNLNPLIFLKDLQIKNIENTDILEISYATTDPRQATQIVNSLMKVYIENDINANRLQTKSARQFIAEQLPKGKLVLNLAERRMLNFKQENRVLDLRAEAASSASILADLDKQVVVTKSALSVQTAKMASIRRLFGINSQEAVIAGFVGESPNVTQVLQQLQQTQQKLAISRLTLNDTHPTVINLQEQEVVLKQELQGRIKSSFVGNVGRLNQIKNAEDIVPLGESSLQQRILADYADAETERLSLQVQLKALAEAIQYYRQRANALPQLELQQRQIEREISATESSYQNLLARYQELQVAENMQVSNARVITPAIIPVVPIKSRQYTNLLQGLIGGVLLGAATAFVLEKMDNTIKTTKSAQELLNYTLLAYIPSFSNGSEIPDIIVSNQSDSPMSEAFRMLETNLRFFNSQQRIKVVVVSSSVPKEGKSTISANLAFAMSQLGHKVLLVDADLRKPNQNKIWKVANEIGLSNVIKGQSNLDSALIEITPDLHLITAGKETKNPSKIIGSSQMPKLIDQVAQEYDFVVIDTPPLTVSADATILGKLATGILFVVRPGVADTDSVAIAKNVLDQANQNVLGVVMNGISARQQYYDYAGSEVG
ncbi:MAG: polysaccharide biosynthesis tyrosine autokinase [Aphanizomenon gracile PMC627.10]|nr:polysaccharide biosynthesis tyrosine autokinase [Aphanizomenon gracile PMC627.10]